MATKAAFAMVPSRTWTSATALLAAVRLWFAVAVIGQWTFLYYIAGFYGPSTLEGNFRAWMRNKNLFKGYVPGDTVGNIAFAAHVFLAAVIAFGGALQLIPQLRSRAVAVHRWNGRLFMVTALGMRVTGLYMVWVRGARYDLLNGLAVSLNGVLIIVFSTLAWRAALAREILSHRRWAMRTYLVANGQWFIRVGVFAWVVINQGQRGLDSFFTVWSFGCYLFPLAVLELYLRARDVGSPRVRVAMASGLCALTALMGVGIFGVFMFIWRPLLQ